MSTATTMHDLWTEFMITRSPHLREQLIIAYMPLVRQVVGRLYIPTTSMFDSNDLAAYGIIGLIHAIDRYDAARGTRFESFAATRIRGAVIDQLRAMNWFPRSAMARMRNLEQVQADVEQQLGRVANSNEVAQAMGVSLERYHQMMNEAGTVILSIDMPLAISKDEDKATLTDLLVDQSELEPLNQLEQKEMLGSLHKAIAQLSYRERLLLFLYYREQRTMKEISVLLQISESRVCQIHGQVLLKLRAILHQEGIFAASVEQLVELCPLPRYM